MQIRTKVVNMSLSGGQSQDYTRFRSFAERYVIERAGTFERGYEQRDAWNAIMDAKTIFGMIGNVDSTVGQGNNLVATQVNNLQAQATQATQAAPMVGSIGGMPYTNDPVELLRQAQKVYGGNPPPSILRDIAKVFGAAKYGQKNFAP
jgi:hypothetical protein